METLHSKNEDDLGLFDALTIRESAQEIKKSSDFIRDEISKGHIAVHRLGGRIMITREDLSAYLSRCRVAAYAERTKASAKTKRAADEPPSIYD